MKTNDNLVGRDEGEPKHKTNAPQFHHVKNAQTRETTGLTEHENGAFRTQGASTPASMLWTIPERRC